MTSHETCHVVCGDSAAGSLKQALGRPGGDCLLTSHDLLSCGPLGPLGSPGEWLMMREDYWWSLEPPDDIEGFDGPAELISHPDVLRAARTIRLWAGTGLAEQLLLAFLPQLLRLLEIPRERLRLVQYSRLWPEGRKVIAIGALSLGRLREHPAPEAPTAEAFAELDAAWQAAIAPDPAGFVAFANGTSAALRWLRPALRALLGRYPDHRSGLTHWDRLLLQHAGDRPLKAARIISFTMAEDDGNPDTPGDVYLFARLKRLGDPRLPHPLLAIDGNGADMRSTEARLTASGARVLRGEANAVALNGIDEWIGGVHLQSRSGSVWFYRDGALVRG